MNEQQRTWAAPHAQQDRLYEEELTGREQADPRGPGALSLRTPFILPPLKLGYSDGSGIVTARHRDFYLTRCGALGAVTLEPLFLDAGLREIPTQLGIATDAHIEGLRVLVRDIQRTGSKVIAHLNHPGRMANPRFPGNYHLSSTADPCENGGAVPRRMDRTDMDRVIALHVDAARRARAAGFDLLELQFGHGYLMSQFLSPAVNDRDDEYGGCFEARARFPLGLLEAVMRAVDVPLIVRVSGEEMIPGGISIEETVSLVERLAERGVRAVHVSAGSVCSTPPWFFQHMVVPKGKTWQYAHEIHTRTGLPTIYVGRIHSAEDIDMLRHDYGAEYLAIGRALVADPGFIEKYLGKIPGNVRPCLACSEGCLGGVRAGTGLGCVVNPFLGRDDIEVRSDAPPQRVAVVGGGIAGMEAARTLRRHGQDVTVFEKGELGGQFNLASVPPHKDSLRELVEYYRAEMALLRVHVEPRECTPEDLSAGAFAAVILATGAVPAIPPIEGLRTFDTAVDVLAHALPSDESIVVIGGGLIGIETASALSAHGNAVTVVEILDEAAVDMEAIERATTFKQLAASGVRIHTGTRVRRVDGRDVVLEGRDAGTLHDIDRIVIATGMKSETQLFEAIRDRMPVVIAGDARKVSNAQQAITQGHNAALDVMRNHRSP